MSLVLVLAATIALRADPPAITFAEARAMTPAQLADAMLAPGHPVVVAAEVGRHAPMPPPPPGASSHRLQAAGHSAATSLHCHRGGRKSGSRTTKSQHSHGRSLPLVGRRMMAPAWEGLAAAAAARPATRRARTAVVPMPLISISISAATR